MKVGYIRVSTEDQNLDLQRDAMKAAGIDKIYAEKESGAKEDRIELNKMLDFVREGDQIVIWKLDRLGRSVSHLVKIVNSLNKRNIELVSLREGIDTSTAAGRLTFNIFASIAEFERETISERTKAGIESARKRGKVIGRSPKMTDLDVWNAFKMRQSGCKMKDIAKTFNVSVRTLELKFKPLRKH